MFSQSVLWSAWNLNLAWSGVTWIPSKCNCTHDSYPASRRLIDKILSLNTDLVTRDMDQWRGIRNGIIFHSKTKLQESAAAEVFYQRERNFAGLQGKCGNFKISVICVGESRFIPDWTAWLLIIVPYPSYLSSVPLPSPPPSHTWYRSIL